MHDVTDERITRLMKREHFTAVDIKYMIRDEQHTQFHLLDGRMITHTIPLKTAAASLPKDDFWSIQKGIVVAARYTVDIDKRYCYTMVDGRQFQGRGRTPKEHQNHRSKLKLAPLENFGSQPSLDLLAMCNLMDKSPLPFFLIELTIALNGRPLDFVYRYCNKAIETVDELSIESMLNKSLFQAFPDEDLKRIVPFADVAVNGNHRTIHEYSAVLKKHLTIQCFQPKLGFCACFLTVDGKDY